MLTATGTLANINPLRYRGYYYDTETSLYYLQSRYYDPATGRFLNADGYASTGQGLLGCNMYAYCNNNPISHNDSGGAFPVMAVDRIEEEEEESQQERKGNGVFVLYCVRPNFSSTDRGIRSATAIGTYYSVRAETKGTSNQAHHIEGVRFYKHYSELREVYSSPGKMLSVGLDKASHQAITNAIRPKYPYGTKITDSYKEYRANLKNIYDSLGVAHWLDGLDEYTFD